RHRALFLDMSNAIASVLEATVATVSPSLSSSAPPWLGALIRHWHEQRCTVLTLNYDTLIEVAAAGVRVEGERSIAPRDLYPTLLTDASARTGDHSSSERHESFRLLKLHGSTNWYYSGRTAAAGETIYFVPPLRPGSADEAARRRHEHLIRAVADKYPFMVPPIYDKSPLLTHETIRALWFDAGEALRSARRIICMGYSLPSSDLTMMHFLRTNCGESARIEIVNESRAAAENFHRLFARTKVQVDVAGSGETCVPAFLEHHLRRRR
ncbi:MAG TPA: hypothetical protein VHF69_10865, partial [Candidatus Synoicihabitans sp.]|nr:hypothetical protein [Candidatus Synoicihabitans sp.]